MNERRLWWLLGFLALATVAGALYIMLKMDPGSRSQGGRFYVAIAALVLIAVMDKQIERLVRRRAPVQLGVTGPERRYAGISLLLWGMSAAVLMCGLWLLP